MLFVVKLDNASLCYFGKLYLIPKNFSIKNIRKEQILKMTNIDGAEETDKCFDNIFETGDRGCYTPLPGKPSAAFVVDFLILIRVHLVESNV